MYFLAIYILKNLNLIITLTYNNNFVWLGYSVKEDKPSILEGKVLIEVRVWVYVM